MVNTAPVETLPEVAHSARAIAVARVLSSYRYRFDSETKLHEGMAEALKNGGIAFEQEVVAGAADRFDFKLDGGIVVEAKIKGSFAKALEQCSRYAEREDVTAVVLAASRFWAGAGGVPTELAGKPFVMVKLQARVF